MGREQFNNTVKVEWHPLHPRIMILLEDIIFTDSNGLEWLAPADSSIDGASIPRFFWRVIGSPFIGKYRRPSVLHDVYCANKSRPAQETHDMFLEAMIADGVQKSKAGIMYNAVDTLGPRW